MLQKVRLKSKIAGVVRYHNSDLVLLSRGQTLFVSFDTGATWKSIGRVPLGGAGKLKASHRYLRRLLRWDIHHVRPTGDGNYLLFGFGRIFLINPHNNGRMEECGFISGSRPLALCQMGPDDFYYGEYRHNRERTPIYVWHSADQGRNWTAVWEFDAVRHVHGVFEDPYTGSIWVTTGDENEESGIWVTHDRFKTLSRVIGGSQHARAVQLLFTPEHVFFGSDAPAEVNYLCCLSRQTGEIRRLQQVEGPVFYGCKVGERLFFSTVCEPTKVNRSRQVLVWTSLDGKNWERFLSFRKDLLPPRLFQYGQVLFPAGPGSSRYLWLTPFATQYDQVSFYFDLDPGNS